MKKFKYKGKDYNFVNQIEIDGVLHTAYRLSNHKLRPVKKIGGVDYIALNVPENAEKNILVSNGKVMVIKDLKKEWKKLYDKRGESVKVNSKSKK